MSHFGLGLISSNGTPGNDAFTKILLHMDGSNGGTTFTDVNAGGSAHTWTPTSATTSTSSAKFGPSSLLCSTGYISTPAHSDFDIGTNDACFDFWYNNNGISGGYGIAGQQDSSGTLGSTSFIMIRSGDSGFIQITIVNASASGTTSLQSTTGFASTSTWNHVALTKSGTSFRLFINGTQEDSTKTLDSVRSSSQPFTIGRAGDGGSGSSVRIDEVRFSVGTARWTSNFTPSTSQYI